MARQWVKSGHVRASFQMVFVAAHWCSWRLVTAVRLSLSTQEPAYSPKSGLVRLRCSHHQRLALVAQRPPLRSLIRPVPRRVPKTQASEELWREGQRTPPATIAPRSVKNRSNGSTSEKVVELLLCILHPIAVVLIWVTLPFKSDPKGVIPKLTWGVASIVPFVPFVYVLTGHDFL